MFVFGVSSWGKTTVPTVTPVDFPGKFEGCECFNPSWFRWFLCRRLSMSQMAELPSKCHTLLWKWPRKRWLSTLDSEKSAAGSWLVGFYHPRNSRPYDQGLWKPLVSLNKAGLWNPCESERGFTWPGGLGLISHNGILLGDQHQWPQVRNFCWNQAGRHQKTRGMRKDALLHCNELVAFLQQKCSTSNWKSSSRGFR